MKNLFLSAIILASAFAANSSALAQERVPVPAPEMPEPALPPGLNENLFAEWKLRDVEGRFVLWQGLVQEESDEAILAWHSWLAQREEFELLERDALDDTGWGSASSTLQDADAPQWLRLAYWHSSASDSHTWDAAKGALESRPELTLAWFEAHPQLLEEETTRSLYDSLAKGCSEREACAKYLPPHDLEVLYAPLVHAGDGLVEFGDRLVASSGERYVHQTLHAMQVLAGSKRRPQIWQRRLFDLASAKNLTVRLAALQASTRLDPESIPWPEFRALFDSRGEPDAVRGAAWIALTYAPRVIARRNYLEVLTKINEPGFSEVLWTLFAERLPEVGGWYENRVLHEQPETLPGEVKPKQFIDTINRVMTGWDTRSASDINLAVQSELELFAFLRTQHEGLQEQLSLSSRPDQFLSWMALDEGRRAGLDYVAHVYVGTDGVFPGGGRAAIDGASRDAAAWKELVIQEAEALLAR